MGRGGRRQGTHSNRKGNFDPNDEQHVKHTHVGKVWELYEEKQPELAKIPLASRLNLERYLGIYDSLPFVWRMLKDIGSIRACWLYLGLYLAIQFMLSLSFLQYNYGESLNFAICITLTLSKVLRTIAQDCEDYSPVYSLINATISGRNRSRASHSG